MVINATNIGGHLTGLGRFTLCFVRLILTYKNEVDKLLDSKDLTILINESALVHFNEDERKMLTVLSSKISPDHGLKGHLLRLLYTNLYSVFKLKKNEFLVNTSQLEFSFFTKNQVVVVHDLIPIICPEVRARQYPYFKHILPFVLRKIFLVATVSNYTKNMMVKHYKLDAKKIFILPNLAPQLIPNQDQKTKNNHSIFFVGRPSISKNIDGIFDAFFALKEKRSDLEAKLRIGGFKLTDYEFSNERLKQIEKHQACITFLDRLSDSDLKNEYSKADVFFYPTLHEGFGLPPIEAMSYGVPVLISNTSCLPEIYSDGALYCDPFDVKDMADKLAQILTDNALRINLRDKSQSVLKKYSIEAIKDDYFFLLKQLS